LLIFLLLIGPVKGESLEHPAARPVATQKETETSDAVSYRRALRERLQAALAAKGPDYQPRTERLLSNGIPMFTNRLILEDSLYLLQHAHNPVDWFAWGAEAFEKARRENKPVFLSIGYSTCHWCHVMERESFDNLAIARLMNKHFVSIKVDRERRPDVDKTYMTAVMLITGNGGWPLSSFLTPDGTFFFGGTYFRPKEFTQLLKTVSARWRAGSSDLIAQADEIADAVRDTMAAGGEVREVGKAAIQKAVAKTLTQHDTIHGGFGNAPKFPNEPFLFLLLETAHRSGNKLVIAAVEKSLTAMAEGGIYDQVGGGFHRYSTDSKWLVPHFEKMLYNQAHLARAYLDAYQLTGKQLYARIASQTLDYVLRDMTSPSGGFYSASDADSEGKEGTFFLWTPEQISKALNPEYAMLALDLYGITAQGNFEGKNILHLPVSLEAYAKQHKLSLPRLLKQVDSFREQLRVARDRRIPPLRDDKILTAWNGMMITSLARAGEGLLERRYLEAARLAAEFLWKHNRRGQGELWRAHLQGSSSVPALQEDYAYLAEALIILYDVSGERVWLERAQEVVDGMIAQFWDEESGGFFMNAEAPDPPLMIRPKDTTDGAIPSGNSVAVRALALLAKRTGKMIYQDKANVTLTALSSSILSHPISYTYLLLSVDELLYGEVGPRQYGANGGVKATARLTADKENVNWLTVELKISPGWHINGHKPLQENLTPTTITLDGDCQSWLLGTVDYPTPEVLQLGFQKERLALYQGTVHIRAKVTRNVQDTQEKMRVVPIYIRLQACDDRACLPPETLVLRVSTTT